jgi:DNA gyrase subunit A
VDEISVQGRNTQGVRLIRLGEGGERLVGIERVASLESNGDEVEETGTSDPAPAEPR